MARHRFISRNWKRSCLLHRTSAQNWARLADKDRAAIPQCQAATDRIAAPVRSALAGLSIRYSMDLAPKLTNETNQPRNRSLIITSSLNF